VDGSLRIARVQSRFRGVTVTIDLPEGLPRILADEHQLAQVLVNLFLNAGDAQEGQGSLRIGARALPERVALEVADGGPGIPRENLARVFDPFFTTKEPGRGTGLGLAICHRIMESFGGEISAGNAPGGGAAFTLFFRTASDRPDERAVLGCDEGGGRPPAR
jgi:signal transduction histidine kinase